MTDMIVEGQRNKGNVAPRRSREAQKLILWAAFLVGCSSSATNGDSKLFGSGGAAGATGLAGSTAGSAGTHEDATSECVPFTCEALSYQCGVSNKDGCGGTIVCGPAYERHPWEDWPWKNNVGDSCPEERPYSWSCGPFLPPGGDSPYPDCVHFPGYATWCCPESA